MGPLRARARAMADYDILPDATTLASIHDLEAACNWAQVQGDAGDPRTLLGAFVRAAGGRPTLVQVARMPRSAMEALASNLRVDLAPAERGRCRGRRGCRTSSGPGRAHAGHLLH